VTGPGATTLFSNPTSVFATCSTGTLGSGIATCSDGPNPEDDPSVTPNPALITTGLAAFIGLGTFDLTAAITSVALLGVSIAGLGFARRRFRSRRSNR
jgi:hypothetical protein